MAQTEKMKAMDKAVVAAQEVLDEHGFTYAPIVLLAILSDDDNNYMLSVEDNIKELDLEQVSILAQKLRDAAYSLENCIMLGEPPTTVGDRMVKGEPKHG